MAQYSKLVRFAVASVHSQPLVFPTNLILLITKNLSLITQLMYSRIVAAH
jgi:hypothetical protein